MSTSHFLPLRFICCVLAVWTMVGANRGHSIETPIGYPGNINTPDFNNDGAPDIAVVNFLNDTFAVRLNNGEALSVL